MTDVILNAIDNIGKYYRSLWRLREADIITSQQCLKAMKEAGIVQDALSLYLIRKNKSEK
jgi:hypothetical protein